MHVFPLAVRLPPKRASDLDRNPQSIGHLTLLRALGHRVEKWSRRAQLERAVIYGVAAKLWMLVAGPVSAILVASQLTPVLQGFYYTFASLMALQVFAELGLGMVLAQFASHEWSHLSLDAAGNAVGDAVALSRLRSLARLGFRWYAIAATVVVIGLIVGGTLFFRSSPSAASVRWLAPWLVLCVVAGMSLCLVPVWSLLEGCNQVERVLRFRLWQGMVGSVTIWVALLAGARLWTSVLVSSANLALAMVFILGDRRRFLQSVLSRPCSSHVISWRLDILPMQWRIAVSWISGYFSFSLFTPVLFKYQGPVIAGQMGLTWSLVSVIGLLPGAWLAPQVPRFGMLIARRAFGELDALFWRVTRVVAAVTVLLGGAVWAVVAGLRALHLPLGERVLSPLPVALFAGAQVLLVFSWPFSVYLRAHKREPLMWLSVLSAVLIGGATWMLGRSFSATGVALGYFVAHLIIIPWVILIWQQCRRSWHSAQPGLRDPPLSDGRGP